MSEIPCAVCGAALTDAEIAFLWTDVDWLDHGGTGDHYASVAPRDREAYFVHAKGLETQRRLEIQAAPGRETP